MKPPILLIQTIHFIITACCSLNGLLLMSVSGAGKNLRFTYHALRNVERLPSLRQQRDGLYPARVKILSTPTRR